MHTLGDIFGLESDDLARADYGNAGTPYPTFSTAENSPYNESSAAINPAASLLDPRGSAMFWIAVAAIAGLILVTGQLRVEAAIGGRAGRGRGKR